MTVLTADMERKLKKTPIEGNEEQREGKIKHQIQKDKICLLAKGRAQNFNYKSVIPKPNK